MNSLSILLSWLKYQKQRFNKHPRYLLTMRVRSFIKNPNSHVALNTQERKQMVKFLHRHLVEVFNYPFINKYLWRYVHIKFDKNNGLHYVFTDEKRKLYFKRGLTKKAIRIMYNSLCIEQDKLSPHNYCFDDLAISKESVVADIGSAEGNFSLKFIDKIKKLYLFECDKNWIEALNATFNNWKEKVVIVDKYVSNYNGNNCVSLDNFFKDKEKPTLLKLDVEGMESEVIDGAKQLCTKNISDLLVCTYHRNGDEQKLSHQLREMNYSISHSPGYMLFIWEYNQNYDLDAPFDFRRGLIHAVRYE
jgi:hypothetical protein